MDLRSRPTLSDLMSHVAIKTPTKWMELGIQLGLEAAQLLALEDEYRGKSVRIFAAIFEYWTNNPGDKPVIWSTVIEALKSALVNEMALAHHLESISSSSSSSSMDGWQQSHE